MNGQNSRNLGAASKGHAVAPHASDKQLPLVSVVIASSNAARTLSAKLRSVRAQSYPQCEAIVVDDGSTDVIGELVTFEFPEARYIRKGNGGLPTAQTERIRASISALIALMDADDLCAICVA